MKKTICLATVTVLIFAFSAVSFAEYAGQTKKHKMGKQMKAGICKKHAGLMMKKMMSGQMVATKDGGVVVMMGNRLLKYDKDLNLKKEVKIRLDCSAMHKKMQRKEKCKKHQEKMQKKQAQ